MAHSKRYNNNFEKINRDKEYSLEDAVEFAMVNLMEWMVAEYSVEERDAYMHMCLNPDFRVNVYQMVRLGNLEYTVGAEIPKKYLHN